MLERWVVTGLEISRVVEQFTDLNGDDYDLELPHHEEGGASQQRFWRHVTDLLTVRLSRGNLFEENSADRVTLVNKVCIDESAAASVCIQHAKQ